MRLTKTAIALSMVLATSTTVHAATTVQNTQAEKPNVVLIMTDDMGFSDISCYGGEIPTPNICDLAESGVKMVDYYTNPMSAPTRSMLLTGVDNHDAGLGNMPPLMSRNQVGVQGYEGILNNKVVTIPEMLGDDYNSYMTGKWHLGHGYADSPFFRGFDKSFEFTGGGVSHFGDQLPMNPFEAPFFFYKENGEKVNTLPNDFYSSDYYTSKMIEYIGDTATDKPFFSYLALTAPHDPLHAPDEWLAKSDPSIYEAGYERIRQARLAKVKALGIVPENTPDVRNNGDYKPWDDLTADEQKKQAKIMSVYAAMIMNLDDNVGRLVNHLKDIGEFDNTIFVYTHDNGSGPKPANNYTGNTASFMAQFDNSYENIGKPSSFTSMGAGFAEAASTPWSFYKTVSGQGGIRVPMIISGKGIKQQDGFVKTGNMHVTDIAPTILDWTNTTKPTAANGQQLFEFDGKSVVPFLNGDTTEHRGADEIMFLELNGFKAIIQGDEWKLREMVAKYRKSKTDGGWRLFNIKQDPAEQNDLSKSNPEKFAELMTAYKAYAVDVGIVEKDWTYPEMYRDQTWSIRQDVDKPFNANPAKDKHYKK